jgi:predicted ABC-type ATPase
MIVFGGPNGSGKSTITSELRKQLSFPQLYINADIIAEERNLSAYDAAVEAERMRRNAIGKRLSFAMETVLSTHEKIDLMHDAKASGYEIVLIYITTQDPVINLGRVSARVAAGGHDVPEEKTLSRYERSMKLLPEAIRVADLAEVYNNSLENPVLIAEKTRKQEILVYPQKPPSRWTEKKIKRLIGNESARAITPEYLQRVRELRENAPDPASGTSNLSRCEAEYMRHARAILAETGRWPGERADTAIAAFMLKQGYELHGIKTAIEKKSPETAEKTHKACLEYLDKVMQAPAVVKELRRNRGITR